MGARRARALIEAHHQGRIDRRRLAEGLARLYVEELAAPLAPERLQPLAGEPEAGGPPGMPRPPASTPSADPFVPRPSADGLWLLLVHDRCHLCGRAGLPVVALAREGEEPEWVHVCLDDLERIRGEARAFLGEGDPGGEGPA